MPRWFLLCQTCCISVVISISSCILLDSCPTISSSIFQCPANREMHSDVPSFCPLNNKLSEANLTHTVAYTSDMLSNNFNHIQLSKCRFSYLRHTHNYIQTPKRSGLAVIRILPYSVTMQQWHHCVSPAPNSYYPPLSSYCAAAGGNVYATANAKSTALHSFWIRSILYRSCVGEMVRKEENETTTKRPWTSA